MTDTDQLPAKPGQLRVLHVEDNQLDAELVARALRQGGFDVSVDVVQEEIEFTQQLRACPPEVILADYNLPHWKGMEALEVLRREGLDIPMILVSGALGDMTAVECIKRGATDYVLKDGLARLPEAIRRALQEKELRRLRRRVDEDLARKVDELARSNADLEQFAYVASHDLQEPLRMVANYTQLLAERYRGKLDDQADKYIHYAVDGAKRMQTLIQDLLAYSRVGRPEIELKRTECDVVVLSAVKNLHAAIGESGAVVTFGSLPAVMANSSQLQQVFQNLIGNAIKFRGANTPQIQVAAEEKEGKWIFSVTDNGIGILNMSVQFSRSSSVFTPGKNTQATGLDSPFANASSKRHGGRISVTSNTDGGSTFVFTIPAGRQQA
jgi:two-component system, sensor histidine kinase and response regulator